MKPFLDPNIVIGPKKLITNPQKLIKNLHNVKLFDRLSYGRKRVLETLIEHPSGCTMRELAAIVGITKSTAYMHLKHLKESAYAYETLEDSGLDARKRRLIQMYYANYPTLLELVLKPEDS